MRFIHLIVVVVSIAIVIHRHSYNPDHFAKTDVVYPKLLPMLKEVTFQEHQRMNLYKLVIFH